MSEQEPSYYEVSLTNRQVLVSFIVVLALLLTVFVFGAWLGRRSCHTEIASPPTVPEGPVDEVAQLDELEFFNDEEQVAGATDADGEPLDRPDLGELLERPRTDTTLAEDLERPRGVDEPATPPPSTPPPSPPPPTVSTPPPSTPPPSTPPPSTPPPQAAAEPTTGFIIQVFSSHDEAQARRVLRQLRTGGHTAYLSPRQVDGRTMFRVRIGPFDQRSEADRIAPDIVRRYRLETWVTSASN